MSPFEYLPIILENLSSLFWIIFLLSFPYWRLARKIAVSVYDPMFFIIFADWMGSSLVVFMWLQSDISDNNFYYFFFSQVAFILGMLIIQKNKSSHATRANFNRSTALPFLILVSAAAIHFFSTLLTWSIAGIPLFRASRLGAFVDSGGFGFIERLQTGSVLIAIFSACFILGETNHLFRKRVAIVFFLWVAVSVFLSGSKGSLLVIAQVIFAYLFIYKREKFNVGLYFGGKRGVIILFAATIFALIIIAIQTQGDLIGILSSFAFRLISYGDIFMYAYPNETIKLIQGHNPLIGIFGGFLSTFRVLPVDMIYTNMGLQFTSIVFPDLDYLAGPNPRHNVFGYHFFEWYGLLYSFALGCLVIYLQRLLFYSKKVTFVRSLVSFLLYFSLLAVVGDIDYAMSTFASCIIVGVLVLFLSLPFLPYHRENKLLQG